MASTAFVQPYFSAMISAAGHVIDGVSCYSALKLVDFSEELL
jgi:hypothetical protein